MERLPKSPVRRSPTVAAIADHQPDSRRRSNVHQCVDALPVLAEGRPRDYIDPKVWERKDMRLALGTMLGIEEDGWESEDVDDPQMAILHYLGFVQDSLVRLVM